MGCARERRAGRARTHTHTPSLPLALSQVFKVSNKVLTPALQPVGNPALAKVVSLSKSTGTLWLDLGPTTQPARMSATARVQEANAQLSSAWLDDVEPAINWCA